MFSLSEVNDEWTLFLDRDGVINHEMRDDYVKNWEEFRFYNDTLVALAKLKSKFSNIFIVTNQRGIGKGLMTVNDLDAIHDKMLGAIRQAGGEINKIFYCTDLEDNSPNRKPNPGMAFEAKKQFPAINLSKSIMVGNRPSDMAFGRNAGMKTIFLATTHPETKFPDAMIDFKCNHLIEFAQMLGIED